MKKVLYVSNRTGYSGAEVVLLRLIQNNPKVEPVVLAPRGLLSERLINIGVKVYYSNNIFQLNRKQNQLWKLQIFKNLIFGFIEFAIVVLRERPDIIHANGLGASIYVSLPTLFFGKPFVWTDHDVFDPDSIESKWTKRISRFSNKIITVSHFVEDSLRKIGIPDNKLVTIYNGLDYSRFDQTKIRPGYIRGQLNIKKDKKIIALFAMITFWKGHHMVLKAAKKLRDQGTKNFVVVFVGDTDDENYREEIEKKIKSYKLQDIVYFLGFVKDPTLAYKDVDILLNSSVKPEPLGTTIYEGMAMERLLLVSNIGGNPEIVEDGKSGFLFDPFSSSDLAAKIDYCLKNENNLSKISKQARIDAEKKFSLKRMVDSYNEIYQRVAR